MEFRIESSLLHLLHRVSQIGHDWFAHAAGSRVMSVRQLVVLSTIDAYPGASQTEIVRLTGIDRSTMTELTRRLSKAGLITRRRTKDDARAYAIKLTDKGEATLRSLVPVLADVEAGLLARVSENKRAALLDAVTELLSDAEHAKPGSVRRLQTSAAY